MFAETSSAGFHNGHSPRSVGDTTQSVKVYVDDVDRHFERAKAAGAKIVTDIAEGFWGDRYYRATDPEGHLWPCFRKAIAVAGNPLVTLASKRSLRSAAEFTVGTRAATW